jgi:hypothetical protein
MRDSYHAALDQPLVGACIKMAFFDLTPKVY